MVVLGLGDTGLSMTRWLARRGADVRVADTRETPPRLSSLREAHPDLPVQCGAWSDAVLADVDAIAISPGIDRREPPIARAIARGVPTVGDVELFAQALPLVARERSASRPRVLAITGSNGKSTVTAMTGAACRAAGQETLVAGNIGLPVLDALEAIEGGAPLPQTIVLELSSFQLESTESLAPDAATVLNISEDHLDRYNGLEDYAAAKARIFKGAGVRVVNREDARSLRMAADAPRVVSFGLDTPRSERDWGVHGTHIVQGSRAVMALADVPLAGLHNAANAMASLALGEAIGLDSTALAGGLRTFRGLPHRLERVTTLRGVTFFNDSKGTNVGATAAALGGMTQPVVLIAGGDGKGQDFSPLAAPVRAKARSVVLIGRDREAIAEAIESTGVPLIRCESFESALDAAYRASRAGDAVLLSPACASFDMFKSYVQRGEVFVELVRALSEREGAA